MSDAEPSTLSPVVALRVEAARRLGCTVTNLDDETGYLFEVRRGARRVVLLGGYSPLNNACAARIATDKFHTSAVLRRAGFRVPEGVRCLQPGRYPEALFAGHTGLIAARHLAAQHGYPLVVKPNQGARGRDVLMADDDDALAAAVEQVWRHDVLALVQTPVAGHDVRLDFIDDTYLFGYTRQPVSLVGDGRQTLAQLVADCDARFATPEFQADLAHDPIWARVTTDHDLSLDSVVSRGTRLAFDTPILNLNRLCLAERLITPPARWLEAGLAIGRALDLRHFGIDFKAWGIDTDPAEATIIEVNASPSLFQMSRMGHYETTVAAEMKIIEAALAS